MLISEKYPEMLESVEKKLKESAEKKGLDFADKIVYKLEELDLENPVTGPEDGKEYIVIASLSGASDCLVFDPATKEVFELTDDGKMRTGDFVYHVIQEGFEYLEDE